MDVGLHTSHTRTMPGGTGGGRQAMAGEDRRVWGWWCNTGYVRMRWQRRTDLSTGAGDAIGVFNGKL